MLLPIKCTIIFFFCYLPSPLATSLPDPFQSNGVVFFDVYLISGMRVRAVAKRIYSVMAYYDVSVAFFVVHDPFEEKRTETTP